MSLIRGLLHFDYIISTEIYIHLITLGAKRIVDGESDIELFKLIINVNNVIGAFQLSQISNSVNTSLPTFVLVFVDLINQVILVGETRLGRLNRFG